MPAPLVFDPDATFEHTHKFWRWFKGLAVVLFVISFTAFIKLSVEGFLLGPASSAPAELSVRGAAFLCFAVPLLLTCARPRYYRVNEGEIILLRYRVIERIRSVWWITLILWPGYIVGLLMLFQAFTAQSVQPASFDGVTSGIGGLILCAFVTGAVFLAVLEVRMDEAGIRVGSVYFTEWENVQRVVDTGSRFEVFHVAYPSPMGIVPKENRQAVALLQRQLSAHKIPLETGSPFDLRREVLLYGSVALLALIVTLVTWQAFDTSEVWTVAVALYAGLYLTVMVGRWRGLSKVTRITPRIDRASLRLKPGQTLGAPRENAPPIPEP